MPPPTVDEVLRRACGEVTAQRLALHHVWDCLLDEAACLDDVVLREVAANRQTVLADMAVDRRRAVLAAIEHIKAAITALQ